MNDLVFAQPAWLWGCLALVPLLGLRIWSHLRGRGTIRGLVSPRLHRQLVNGGGQSQRWTVFVLQALALAATFAALARPQLGFDEVDTQTEARNLILAIDTSRSMLAEDLRPDRLSRAKLAATDIVRALPEDRIGLIAFAGRPFLQAPLTVDHEAILEAIDQMDTEIIPRGGTNLAAAASLAIETFEEAELDQSALVVFSDGEALEGLDRVESVRERAREVGMAIISVGVGTSGGAIIPELDERGERIPGQFVMDEAGQVVRSRLDPAALQGLASRGGVYVHLGGDASLTRVVEQIRSGISTSRANSESRLRPIERFLWPLSFAVGCLVLAHLVPLLWMKPTGRTSRGVATLQRSTSSLVVTLLLAAGALLPESARAEEDPLFSGHEAFRTGDYETAISTLEKALTEKRPTSDRTRIGLALGAAAYRQGDFEKATSAYGEALVGSDERLREHAHYNLGNTLFRHGESALRGPAANSGTTRESEQLPAAGVEATIERWESAIEHYEAALALNESNERAAHNIEIVKRRIDELKKQQDEEEQEQEQDEQEQEQEQEQQDEQEQEQQDGENESDQENQQDESDSSSENGSPDSESGSDESENQPEESPDEPSPEDSGGDESNPPEENPEDESSDNSDPSEQDGEGDSEEQESPRSPPPGNPENEDGTTPEGELEADPNQEQPSSGQAGQSDQAGNAQRAVNPETGYSPSEARQLLEALADETEVRPILAPARGEKFKNW